ncbi:MAG: hypothetical protein H6878_02415 [Rhodobiaceae bacterium]|nr:hypothetical protein [Rhodobiaceae bacterium]
MPWLPQGLYFKKRESEPVADMKGAVPLLPTATARMVELTGMLPVQVEAAELQALATGASRRASSLGATGCTARWEHLTHFYEVDAWLLRNAVFVNKDA